MFKWLIDKQMRNEIAMLQAEMIKVRADVEAFKEQYQRLRSQKYRDIYKAEASSGNKQLSSAERAQVVAFLAGCSQGERETLIAKLKSNGYDVEEWL